MAPALVIFDCDGVLVDSEPISARCWARALQVEGFALDEQAVLDRFVGLSATAIASAIAAEFGRPLPKRFAVGVRAEILDAFGRELRPIPGIARLLAALEPPRCVASSSVPERIRRSLEVTDLIDLLAPHLFSATMVAQGKPAPDLFLLAAARMGVAAKDCAVVEDSVAGVQAARAAGMRVIGFAGGGHAQGEAYRRRLADAGPDHLIDDMADLLPLLQDGAGRGAAQPI